MDWSENIPVDDDAFQYYERLGRVREFGQANLSQELPIQEVAKIAGLSPKYFTAFFRQHTGTCFRDWLASIRIDRARALLSERTRPVTEVAFLVGFRDVRTFQRTFKKLTGMTPRAFKKSVAPAVQPAADAAKTSRASGQFSST